MDPRSAELKAEHGPHGWHVAEDVDVTAGNGFKHGGVIAVCPCGYSGYVSADAFDLVDA